MTATGLPRRGFENRSRSGAPAPLRATTGYRLSVVLQEGARGQGQEGPGRGIAPAWAGLPVWESAIAEAQDTHFSLEFRLLNLRSS